MSYTCNKVLLSDEQSEKIRQIRSDVAHCLHLAGIHFPTSDLLSVYLLYKIATFSKPVDYYDIKENKIGLQDDIWMEIKERLGEKGWLQLSTMIGKYSAEEFANTVVTYDISDSLGRFDDTVTPQSVVKLSKAILDIQPGERVLDLGCGYGTFLLAAADQVPNAEYIGYEIVASRKVITEIRSELLGHHFQIEQRDAFSALEDESVPRFNKAFSNYPFGMKLRNLVSGTTLLDQMAKEHPNLSKATSSDWVFNALLCELLTSDGKAIGIMTNGSTWNSIDAPMRKYFVENGLIEAIIALPAKLFTYTNIATTMIVLSHGNQTIRMVDASKSYSAGRRVNELSEEDIETICNALSADSEYSKSITIKEICDNEYALNPSRYLESKVIIQNAVPFGSVIKSITRGAPCTAKQLDDMVSETATNMQYLMLANIQDGFIEDKLPYLSHIEPKFEKYCLKNNSLILSKNGYPYKIAVAEVRENQKILANGNLYIIELNEDVVNPYYLKAFFESEQGFASLKSITVGAVIPNIGVEQLKKLQVPVPPMEEQLKFVQRYQAILDEIAVLKLKLEKTKNQLHQIFDEEKED